MKSTGSSGRDLQAKVDALAARGQDAAAELVELMIRDAVHMHASDLHLEPLGKELHARYRIDGVLHDAALIPGHLHDRMVGRVKVLADLVAYRNDVPQDGRVNSDIGCNGVELRVSTFPTIHGEKVVIRVLDSTRVMLRIEDLGFSETIVEDFFRYFDPPFEHLSG